MKITKGQLQKIIQEELSQVSEIKASDGSVGLPDWMMRSRPPEDIDARADIDTVISGPVTDEDNPAVDAMKRLFQRQMRHKIRQFLDFGQSEEDIISAASKAAEEILSQDK